MQRQAHKSRDEVSHLETVFQAKTEYSEQKGGHLEPWTYCQGVGRPSSRPGHPVATGTVLNDDNVTDDNDNKDDNVTDDNLTGDNVTDDNVTDDNVTDDNVTDDNVTDDNITDDNVTDDNVTC
ncbi:hypothetical protein Btru_058103 [Bulinus truncatus]|nr:hypothetical protein Btru_058103 [Bulinus truncatus]